MIEKRLIKNVEREKIRSWLCLDDEGPLITGGLNRHPQHFGLLGVVS